MCQHVCKFLLLLMDIALLVHSRPPNESCEEKHSRFTERAQPIQEVATELVWVELVRVSMQDFRVRSGRVCWA